MKTDYEIEEHRKYCERLGTAIEKAAGYLPEGWNLSVEIEKESGICLLVRPSGETVDPLEYLDDCLPGCIENAIAYARCEKSP